MFPAILLIYLCFPTRNNFWDAIDFAQAIEDAPKLSPTLIHPNHLLYNVLGYFAYKAALGVGLHVRALQALQITNGLLSVLAAVVLFQLLKLSLRSLYLTTLLTLLFAFSATWWQFSTDANAYVPAVLFILISFYLVHPAQRGPRPLLVAITLSAAMCFHQLAVLFFPIVVLGLMLQTPAESRRNRIGVVLQFSIAAFLLTLGIFYYGFYLSMGSLELKEFVRWLTSHSPDSSFTFNIWSDLMRSFRGNLRLLLNGRFNLIKGLVNPFIVALIASLGAAVVILGFQLLRTFREFKEFRGMSSVKIPWPKPVGLICITWILLYSVFLFVWMPQHTFYRLFYWPAVIMLCGLLLDVFETQIHHQHRYRLISLVVTVAIANFLFLIFPYSHAEKWPPASVAERMSSAWPPGTIIYYDSSNGDNRMFKYFHPLTIWKQIPAADAGELEDELRRANQGGCSTWVEASAIDKIVSSAGGAQWLSRHSVGQTHYKLDDPAFRIEFIQLVPETQ
jgi:hypothetical protein